jgi:hypothetical protein
MHISRLNERWYKSQTGGQQNFALHWNITMVSARLWQLLICAATEKDIITYAIHVLLWNIRQVLLDKQFPEGK